MSRRFLLILIAAVLVLVGAVAALALSRPSSTSAAQSGPSSSQATTTVTTATSAATSEAATTSDSPIAGGVTSSDTVSGGPDGATSAGPAVSGGSIPNAPAFLGDPVDGGGDVGTQQDVTMSGISYPNSTEVYCPPDRDLIDWNTAGYSSFTAVVGIGDSEPNAAGSTATVTFSDQDKHQLGSVVVAVGHPKSVNIDVKGAARMEVACSVAPAGADGFNVTFGSGQLNP